MLKSGYLRLGAIMDFLEIYHDYEGWQIRYAPSGETIIRSEEGQDAFLIKTLLLCIGDWVDPDQALPLIRRSQLILDIFAKTGGVCDNVAFLPGGYVQVLDEHITDLGDAVYHLRSWERRRYGKDYLDPQVIKIRRLIMPEPEKIVECAIDAAEKIYTSSLNKIYIPECLSIGTYQNSIGVKYVPEIAIENFRKAMKLIVL